MHEGERADLRDPSHGGLERRRIVEAIEWRPGRTREELDPRRAGLPQPCDLVEPVRGGAAMQSEVDQGGPFAERGLRGERRTVKDHRWCQRMIEEGRDTAHSRTRCRVGEVGPAREPRFPLVSVGIYGTRQEVRPADLDHVIGPDFELPADFDDAFVADPDVLPTHPVGQDHFPAAEQPPQRLNLRS